ncbi:MAG: radical SAM protein [candidate division WOR-3 bacterium]|nr:radical SAM protein [candidate division WOR-3 bacterium]
MNYKYIFGPVPSRRLGISLGIDLIPHKTCSFDCLYCECGKTTNKTMDRQEFVPTEQVLKELNHYLTHHPLPDFATFSGAGEPTLHTGIGEITDFIKDNYQGLKTAMLTNSTTINIPEVRQALLKTDIVLPSLDSAVQETFEQINRPVEGIDVKKVIEGLESFSLMFDGKIWLEIFILEGYNDSADEIAALKRAVQRIKPDRVQLNTMDRPGTEAGLAKASKKTLERVKKALDYESTEIISKYKSRKEIDSYREDAEEAIVKLTERRPATMKDMEEILGLKSMEIGKYLDILLAEKRLVIETGERGVYYRAPKDRGNE